MFPVYAVATSVNSVRAPQSDHCFFLRIGPQKDDVACCIAIGKGQTNDFAIEAFGNLCVCDWKMSLVQVHGILFAPGSRLYLVSMTFRVVLVRLAVFLISGGLMRAVAERLILRKTAHANPDRFLLGLNFKRSLVRF
jgi:hypothetical protein